MTDQQNQTTAPPPPDIDPYAPAVTRKEKIEYIKEHGLEAFQKACNKSVDRQMRERKLKR